MVSGALRPFAYRLDDELVANLAQRQGMSSSMRVFGQPWTRRVSKSVR